MAAFSGCDICGVFTRFGGVIIAGSTPVTQTFSDHNTNLVSVLFWEQGGVGSMPTLWTVHNMALCPIGKVMLCKSIYTGSSPVRVSI